LSRWPPGHGAPRAGEPLRRSRVRHRAERRRRVASPQARAVCGAPAGTARGGLVALPGRGRASRRRMDRLAAQARPLTLPLGLGRAAADGAREFLGRMVPALAPGDVLGSIAFAGQAHVQAYPTGGRRAVEDFIPAADEELDELDTQESDLAVVLTRAASLCPA